MAFDRRGFFQSIAAGVGAVSLAEKLPAKSFGPCTVEQPHLHPKHDGGRVDPVDFSSVIDRRLHCFYDTVKRGPGASLPPQFRMFTTMVGQMDGGGTSMYDPLYTKTKFDTNWIGQSCALYPPHNMFVRRLGLVFQPDCSGNDYLFDHGALLQFWVYNKLRGELRLCRTPDGVCTIDVDVHLAPLVPFDYRVEPGFVGGGLPGRLEFLATMVGFVDFPVA